MDLYHADIRLPDGFSLPNRLVVLTWTNHATASLNRRCEIAPMPVLNLGIVDVIEVGLTGKKVEKVVVRTDLDDENDIVFVLIPRGPERWIVKTVWINRFDDYHRTLDRSRYVQ